MTCDGAAFTIVPHGHQRPSTGPGTIQLQNLHRRPEQRRGSSPTFEDRVENVRVLEAVHQAAETGEVIRLR